jgi:tetraprenyl-beta-curcumene synthase
VRAASRYWRDAFPQARAELRAWRARALRIPAPDLRDAALCALDTKRCDLEGAVGFAAALATRGNLHDAVCAITSFQLAFDYLDCVVELPHPDPIANGRSLHRALFLALSAGGDHADYYRHQASRDDAGYLRLLVDTCRGAARRLPAVSVIREPARGALERIATYQSLSHGDRHGSYAPFLSWAQSQTVHDTDMCWWETGAATGSQLSILALIAAAADTHTGYEQARAIERAYFPWVGALSTLLDSVVDRERDRAESRPSLLDHYQSSQHVAERLRLMATEAMAAVEPLADADKHQMLLAAMGAFFHSRPEVAGTDAHPITKAAVDALGGWTIPARIVFKTRRARI